MLATHTNASQSAPGSLLVCPSTSLTSMGAIERCQHALVYLILLDPGGERRRIKRPIKVEVDRGEEGYVAFAPALEVGGVGATAASATDDLADTVWSMYMDFAHTAERDLHESAIAFLRHVRSLLAE